MKTIIIGRGNLSNALYKSIGEHNGLVLSSSSVVEDPSFLIEALKTAGPCNLILNCFQRPAEFSAATPQACVNNSIMKLSIILEILLVHADAINKLIYTSSSAVYGALSNHACEETAALAPLNLYGALKLACEQLIAFYCKKAPIDYSITRIFNLFGGEDRFSMVSKLEQACHSQNPITLLNQGQAIRDYVHIDDVVHNYMKLLNIKNVPIINIASGQGIATRDLLAFFQEKGFSLALNHLDNVDEVAVSTANIARAEAHLGKHAYISVFSYLEEKLKGHGVESLG